MAFSSHIASSIRRLISYHWGCPTLAHSLSLMRRRWLARGSSVLYMRCPKPMIFFFFSSASFTQALAREGSCTSRSMCITSVLAPPCRDPFRAPMAATTQLCRSLSVAQATRAVNVLALNSWSACRIRHLSKIFSLPSSGSLPVRQRRKLKATLAPAFGSTNGWPFMTLWIAGTRVVMRPSSRMALRVVAAVARATGQQLAHVAEPVLPGFRRHRSPFLGVGQAQQAYAGAEQAHRIRVRRQGLEPMRDPVLQHRFTGDGILEVLQFGGLGQAAVPQQENGLFEARVVGHFVDGNAPIRQNPAF